MTEGETRITLILRSDQTVQTHIEAAPEAEPLDVYDRAINALKAEQKLLLGCPVHKTPTFRQEIERLARRAQHDGDRLDRHARYRYSQVPIGVTFARKARFWLNAASALRGILEKAKAEESYEASDNKVFR